LGAALVLAVPAKAAWHGYFIKQGVNFSFSAPDQLKPEKTTYVSAVAGQRNAVVFGVVENNVEYKITVVDFAGRTNDESALIKEAAAPYQERTKVLLDEKDIRVDSSYGYKLTVDLPDNGGRLMSAIYFKDNHLIELKAIVRPGGDYLSSDMGRFIDSLAFYEMRSGEDGTTELKLTD
jgi:hypothetical protein